MPMSATAMPPLNSLGSSGSAASGWLSMAVTNSAAGVVAGGGIMLKGRVRSVVQSPEAMIFNPTVFDEIARGGPIETVIHLAAHYDFTGEEHPEI